MARIAFVVIAPFADWEPALLAAGARDDFGDEVTWWSPGGHPTPSMGGMTLQVNGAVEDFTPDKADALVLVGSATWMTPQAPDLTNSLRRAVDAGLVVAGICGATVALAKAGLLDGRAHTSNDLEFLKAQAPSYRGASHYRDVPHAVRDGRLVTAAGTAPVTFAMEILGLLHPEAPDMVAAFKVFAREHLAA
ncbi:DJ-1/PfpI family protein [Myxococcus landrumensis]|uniref:DJ-1/PfpI family protein n=1 Tax=Myxococcus landrumensis TaxID=2813577 RepID=A0ABX7N1A4_9BACT|nr:DJ-1/PfpI family protein [Myxococcus landrumus]QSQ12494.1 DJ-1/PfpI family protein [Myxococcus landrumus]